MKQKPTIHKWEPIPAHGGPQDWRCVLCAAVFYEGGERPPGFCVVRAESITTRPAVSAGVSTP